MSAASLLLKQHLQQRQLQGTTHLALRPGSLEKMRGLKRKPTMRAEPQQLQSIAVEPTPDARRILDHPPLEAPKAEPITVAGHTRKEQLTALRALAETWPPALALGSLRQTMVFGVGDPQARLMFIGAAPGAEEEQMREPFVGPEGQKLTGIIKAMGLERSQVYLSKLCKFRPALEPQGHRPPTAAEMRACLPLLLTEIDLVRPQVIVVLGETAATGLGIPGSVSRLRGQFHTTQGIPTLITHPPSYLLREEQMNGGLEAKRAVWEDLLKVMAQLGLPISEKQRGFFQAK